ncbi:LysR family transcriptional regulator [Pseudomonas protegens]|uniref:LysR family transcriptional regulator n=1 Tax=Pseudomonas protegens TaxID=380021 RepID=UPI0034D71190
MKTDIPGDKNSQLSRRRLPPLSALRCFEAAARLESFTQAGATLHLTHGAISRAVRALEEDLGTPLFERRSQRVFLTAAGAELLHSVTQALDLIESTASRLRAPAPAAPLVLSCEPTLLMRWLIPRMPGFYAEHPQVPIQLLAGGGPFSFGAGIDLAIRRNDFAWSRDTQAHWLFDEAIGPVCRPERQADWTPATAGLAQLAAFTIADDLASGRLVPVLEAFNQAPLESFYALYVGQGGHVPSRVRVFIDFLAQRVRL